jgi:hypothetical protein
MLDLFSGNKHYKSFFQKFGNRKKFYKIHNKNKLECFLPLKISDTCIRSKGSLNVCVQAFFTNVRLGWKSLPGTNTLTYGAVHKFTKRIKFCKCGPGNKDFNLFFKKFENKTCIKLITESTFLENLPKNGS